MDDRGARPVGVLDGGLEGAGGRADRARVRRVVEKQGGCRRGPVEVGLPAVFRIEPDEAGARPRERDPRGVVRVVGIGQQDRVAPLGQGQGELDDRGLRPGDDRHLALGVELDAVDRAVSPRDRLAQLREAAEGRVAVRVGPGRGRRERLDDVRGRPDLRVPAPEVDDRRAAVPFRLRDSLEQRTEVLLGQPLEAVRFDGRGRSCAPPARPLPTEPSLESPRPPARSYAPVPVPAAQAEPLPV